MTITCAISADRIGGFIWLAFGATVVYGSWVMDRLESLSIPPLTAPGLVPGLLGLGFMVFGLILVARRDQAAAAAPTAVAGDAAHDAAPHGSDENFHWQRVALSWALCITYGAVLLGRGPPYWVLTAAFLLLHILLLDDNERVPAAWSVRRLAIAAILAPAVATAVTLVFQHVFLVRLP
jgi:putative tricarboxylic transport membrane protein